MAGKQAGGLIGQQKGRSLLEMLIVVAIIALVASVVAPTTSSTHLQRLNLAGSQVAEALRFAREEARRTSILHGVTVDPTNNRVRVFRLDQTATPNTKVFDVYHPTTKNLYTVELAPPTYTGIDLDSYAGTMIGTCDELGNIAFDAFGVVRCAEPTTTRIESANIKLVANNHQLTVAIEDYTGRVSVQ